MFHLLFIKYTLSIYGYILVDTSLSVYHPMSSYALIQSLLMKVKVESEKDGLKLNIQKMKIMTPGPIASCKQCQTLFFWAPKSLQMVTAAMKLKDAYSLEGKL